MSCVGSVNLISFLGVMYIRRRNAAVCLYWMDGAVHSRDDEIIVLCFCVILELFLGQNSKFKNLLSEKRFLKLNWLHLEFNSDL